MSRLLREALEYRGCPICHMLDREESDFIATLQLQALKDEKTRRDLVSANGYCNLHFHQMARLASPMGMAILTEDLVETEIKEIEERPFRSTLRVDCPVCGYTKTREECCVREFSALLSEESFQKEYEATDGLCRIHLKRVLDLLQERNLRQFLVASHMMHLKLLKIELETFVSKVRSTSRDLREEKDSWLVAIEKWVGRRGLNYTQRKGETSKVKNRNSG